MNTFVCPCCLFPGMRGALDKKGRPYMRCWNCNTLVFPRLGDVGFATLASVLRILDDDNAAAFARTSAREHLAQPGGVLSLLSPAPHRVAVEGAPAPGASERSA